MKIARSLVTLALPFTSMLALGCKKEEASATAPAASSHFPSGTMPESSAPCGSFSRDEFNRFALHLNLPLYWAEDRNKNRKVDPDEVAKLLFYPTSGTATWVDGGKFTPAFETACVQMATIRRGAPASTPQGDLERRTLVLEDLDQGRTTLVSSDLRKFSAEERAFATRMIEVAVLLDTLFARQNGADTLRSKIPADDIASQSLFRRNWGPRCVGPRTENNHSCTAIPGSPKPVVDAYPATMQADPAFCKTIEQHRDAKNLLSPFVVVREKEGNLAAVPLNEAYGEMMGGISAKLREAAAGLSDPKEALLKAYLEATAGSFQSNDWLPADEAWTRMNAQTSRWYLRIGPDETYWDPCGHKAGFHLAFALINQASLSWQQKLDPMRQTMEDSLAALIRKPYKSRKVTFHLPDFIDIIVNAGDDRDPMGATIGQSLPNWGKVADEGRGRTVAMSNLYTDPDSLSVDRQQAESILTKDSISRYPATKEPLLLSTILHEATHNLGPSHDYKYKNKTDDQAFGGGLSATMEELKAQTGALWYLAMLVEKGAISKELAEQSYFDSFTWGLNHISRGMYSGDKKPKPYSQLAAVQIGFLLDENAISFDPGAMAANGQDKGAFTIHFDLLAPAVEKLMVLVGGIKATNDLAKAEELIRKYVDGAIVPHAMIAERLLRFPKASFVYSVDLQP